MKLVNEVWDVNNHMCAKIWKNYFDETELILVLNLNSSEYFFLYCSEKILLYSVASVD